MSYFSCAHTGELLRHWFGCYTSMAFPTTWVWGDGIEFSIMNSMIGWYFLSVVCYEVLGTICYSLLKVAVYVHSQEKKKRIKIKKGKRKILADLFSDASVRSIWDLNAWWNRRNNPAWKEKKKKWKVRVEPDTRPLALFAAGGKCRKMESAGLSEKKPLCHRPWTGFTIVFFCTQF